MLAATAQVPAAGLEPWVFAGELSLQGGWSRPRALSVAIAAAPRGRRGVVVPASNAAEAALVGDLEGRRGGSCPRRGRGWHQPDAIPSLASLYEVDEPETTDRLMLQALMLLGGQERLDFPLRTTRAVSRARPAFSPVSTPLSPPWLAATRSGFESPWGHYSGSTTRPHPPVSW